MDKLQELPSVDEVRREGIRGQIKAKKLRGEPLSPEERRFLAASWLRKRENAH